VYDRYEADCRASNIILKPEKRRILWPHTTLPPADLLDGCRRRGISIHSDSMPVLGAWFGRNNDEIRTKLKDSINDFNELFACLTHPDMPTQAAMLLARYCLQPTMNYIARTMPPSLSGLALHCFDEKLLDAVCSIIGLQRSQLSEEAKHLIQSPLRSGGLGFRSYSSIAEASYLASAARSFSRINTR